MLLPYRISNAGLFETIISPGSKSMLGFTRRKGRLVFLVEQHLPSSLQMREVTQESCESFAELAGRFLSYLTRTIGAEIMRTSKIAGAAFYPEGTSLSQSSLTRILS